MLVAFAEDPTMLSCNKTCGNCLDPTVAREVVVSREAELMVSCLSAIRPTVPFICVPLS